jgi:hypothetical protein
MKTPVRFWVLALSLAMLAAQWHAAAAIGLTAAPQSAPTSAAPVAVLGDIPATDARAAQTISALRQNAWQQSGEDGGRDREPLGLLARRLRQPPVPGSWALVAAGLIGVSTIARRRVYSQDRRLAPYRRLRE